MNDEPIPGYLSTGDPSTLGSYLDLCRAFFGDDSNATKFIERKIVLSPKGRLEPVLADETQMVHLLGTLHLKESPLDDLLQRSPASDVRASPPDGEGSARGLA